MQLAWWMWQQRMRYRLKLWWDLITLVIDVWVLLYLVIPAVIMAGWYYMAWLQQLPAWFQPHYLVAMPPLLAIIMLVGSPRTYLCRADLVYIFPHKQSFRLLTRAGKLVSTMIGSLLLLAFWWGIYPFYQPVESVSPILWLNLGVMLLIMRWAILQLKWKLRAILPSNFSYWLLTAGLWLAWSYSVGRNLLGATPFEIKVIAAIWILLPLILAWRIKVSRWESIIADEEYQDLQLMRMFLGHAAQASLPAGRSGRARWWLGRMGIPFNSDYTLAYFFLKFLLRKRKIWSIYVQVYLLVVIVAVQNLTYQFQLLMLALGVGAVGMLTELLWREHAEDLFLRMLPLTWDNCRRSVTKILLVVTLPLALVPLIIAATGAVTWSLAIAGVVGLALVSVVLSGYLGLKLASRLNFSYNNEP